MPLGPRYIPRGVPEAGGTPPPPPPPGQTGIFDLTANPSFDPQNPTIKTGVAFNQEMKDIYNGLLNYYIEGEGELGTEAEFNMATQLGNQDSYNVGRYGYRLFGVFMVFFRLTGDLRLLDAIARYANFGYNGMWTANSNGGNWPSFETSGIEYHEERTWVYTQNTGDFYGNDTHETDTPRAFNTFIQAALALHMNRNETSPKYGAGYYATQADKWIAVYEGYRKIWSADASWDSSWPNGITASNMNSWYNGYWYGSGSWRRQPSNQWPMNRRTFTHTNTGSLCLHYFMGRLLGLENLGQMAMDDLLAKFTNQEVYYQTSGGKEYAFWSRAYSSLTSSVYMHPLTYAEYTIIDLVNMWLDGVPDISDRIFKAAANTYADRCLKGTISSFTSWPDMGGGSDRTGMNVAGETITMPTACNAGAGFCVDKTEYQMVYFGSALLIPWNTKLHDWLRAGWMRRNGSFSSPKLLSVIAGIFLKNALELGGGTTPPPPTPVGFESGDETFGFLGRQFFHSQNPTATASTTLKDGTTFNQAMRTYYNGVLAFLNKSGTWYDVRTDDDNLYTYARYIRDGAVPLLDTFRLTGDLRLLDKVCDYLDGMAAELAVGWNASGRNLYNTSVWDSSDWSPYRCWIGRQSGLGDNYGTDISTGNTMNHAKILFWVSMAAYACYVNRQLVSPSGIPNRYRDTADFWKNWIQNDLQPTWQGTAAPTPSWRPNYEGLRYPTRRASSTDYPFVWNPGDSHSSHDTVLAMHYYGLLFNNPNAMAARDSLQGLYRTQEFVPVQSDQGTAVVWSHGFRAAGSPSTQLQGSIYVGYTLGSTLTVWLAGFDPLWTQEKQRQPVRAFDEWCLLDNGTGANDIGGGVTRGGLDPYASGSGFSVGSAVTYGFGASVVFGSTRVRDIMVANQLSYGSGFNSPNYHPIPCYMFMRESLRAASIISE